MLPVPIYTPETQWNKVACLRKQRDGQGLNPRTSRSGVWGVNHSATHRPRPPQSHINTTTIFKRKQGMSRTSPIKQASPANQTASPSMTTKNSREKPVKTVSGSFLWSQRTFVVMVVKLTSVNDRTWYLADWLSGNRCCAPNLDAALDPNSMAAAILRWQPIFPRLRWFEIVIVSAKTWVTSSYFHACCLLHLSGALSLWVY